MSKTIEPDKATLQRAAYEQSTIRRLASELIEAGYRCKVPNVTRQGHVPLELLGQARVLLRKLLEQA